MLHVADVVFHLFFFLPLFFIEPRMDTNIVGSGTPVGDVVPIYCAGVLQPQPGRLCHIAPVGGIYVWGNNGCLVDKINFKS